MGGYGRCDFEGFMTQSTAAGEELRRALSAAEGGRRWLRRLGIAVGLGVVIAGGLLWRARHRPPPPAKFVTAEVTVEDLAEKVQATGQVQPVLQVNVGAQTNGRVTRVLVDFNSVVKKGDVLMEIDQTFYSAQVSQWQANLLSQRAQLEAAKATASTAKISYERIQRLFEQNLASKADLDTARGQWENQQANADAQSAQIAATQAQLTQQITNIGYTKIYSPVDGVVVTRSIDPGATVVASFQAPVLFVIAQDLRKMRVLADVDEADVGKLKEGMEVEAVVDAFPGETFKGRVDQVRYSPNNVQGVVTYSAVVEVANPEEKLRPGMTATVTIKSHEVKGAATVPNAALRYHPNPLAGPDGKPVVQAPEPALPKGKARVYLLTSDKPGEEKEEQRVVDVGITDGIRTEVLPGSLPTGAKVVTDELDDDKKKKGKLF
jgi:HlyD family secretion protein